MIDLGGRRILVTGGGAGIGRGICEAFRDAGASVATIERDPVRAAEVRAALGDGHLVIEGDVTVAGDVAALGPAIEERWGALDVLVNNVGDFLMIVKRFEDHTPDDVERLYATNMRQLFDVTRAMIPLLRRGGPDASIISVSSIEGFRGIPFNVVYATFKAGVTGFTKSLALDLAPDRIRVNLIAPETTDTPQVAISQYIKDEYKDEVEHWIPLGRFGRPEDMAGAALYLASPLAGWVTGTTIHVDGGALAAAGWYRTQAGAWTNTPVIPTSGLKF